MRVTIAHSQKTTGLIFRTTYHVVETTVEFTDEELDVIQERKLSSIIVMERRPPSDSNERLRRDYDLKIGNLTRGTDSYALDTPVEAKNYDHELRGRLKVLKDYIDGNAEVVPGSDTFEL